MDSNAQPGQLGSAVAEEILRTIYGDDFKGCTIRPERIAEIVSAAIRQQHAPTQEILELYEKVVEAVHLLSTPPVSEKVTDPNKLRALLSERLDAIHVVTAKTTETITRAKARQAGNEV
jgi:hypothetical protein